MFKRLTNLFRPAPSVGCTKPDCEKMIASLNAIIDDEVTEEEKAYFKKHMDDCQPCFDKYQVEKALLTSIRSKLNKKPCPEKIKSQIKAQIQKQQISTQ